MTDIQIAEAHLEGHAICICKDGEWATADGKGVSNMLKFIAEGKDLKGASVADIVVGKAAAMLFVKAGVACVYGKVTSVEGKRYLESHGVENQCGELVENILNRFGTDICPMEKTVAQIDDAEDGYLALRLKAEELKRLAESN